MNRPSPTPHEIEQMPPWTCAQCRQPQPANAKRYGTYYCHRCANMLCRNSYEVKITLPNLPALVLGGGR